MNSPGSDHRDWVGGDDANESWGLPENGAETSGGPAWGQDDWQAAAACPQLQLEKHKGEILGVVVVESGWGSILPTVILANMMNGGPAARSGKLSIGDQIMSINGTSLVGLPLATCQGIIKVGTWGPSVLRSPQPHLISPTHEGEQHP